MFDPLLHLAWRPAGYGSCLAMLNPGREFSALPAATSDDTGQMLLLVVDSVSGAKHFN